MNSIHDFLKKASKYILVLGYNIQDMFKIFHILLDFLKKAPDDYFENVAIKKSFKGVPLNLTEKGTTALKNNLSDYPKMHNIGELSQEPGFKKESNFIYVVGQFLTDVVTKIDFLIESKSINGDSKEIHKLYEIWGSRENMNAGSLFKKYENKNNSTARQELEDKLSRSADIIKKLNISI